jgi:hypothetical protein
MKKFILLFSISIVFVMNSWSQTSNLVVFSEDLNPFYLVVNGIKQNATPETNVKVTNIKTPDNALMVIFQDKALGTVKQNFYFPEMGVEATTKITKTSKGYKLRYFGEVPLQEATASANQYSTSFQNVDAETPSAPVEEEIPVAPTSAVIPTPKEPVATLTPKSTSSNSAVSSGAVSINYKWVAGKKYTFVANQTDQVTTSVMGMQMKDKFKGTTKFLMAISNVDAKGTASGTLYLLDYKVVDSKGRVLASLVNLPATAIKSDFKVDAKGNFTFLKRLTLVTTAQGNVLVYAKANDTSLHVGGEAGDVSVDAYAEFDTKTGAIKAGYSIKATQPVKQIKIKVDENTDLVDVLPYDYLELLVLPEGTVSQGDMSQSTVSIYTFAILAKNISNGIAQLNYKMESDKSKSTFGSSNTIQSENSSMSMEMPNMNQMMSDLSPDEQQGMALTNQMMPSIGMDFDSFFDCNLGMFSLVKGVMNTSINAMGMKINVVSDLEMKRL